MQHTIRLSRTALLLAAAGLALAACGDANPGTSPESPSSSAASPGSSAPAAGATSLTVELMAEGEAVTDTWTLECDGAAPVGNSGAPDPAAACGALAEHGTALMAEPGPDVACTMQYGGPQRATVTGTVDGENVDAAFAYSDGCQISRWDALSGLLGAAGMQ
ncbi:subtilase-type protease inhibitor [Arthrobacter sp. Helios]|uniref:subtilase-type protease inhibitor n=1 Tax=Arthrobacter sp. Helios TaxID=2828862 RepID=UPI00205266D0|nr:subtilase-type protease inhibitor [Arthrobacter sp. Helios]UPO76817.1 subtilase-type protease inhibitor [Arthrobacter sp. Helios]